MQDPFAVLMLAMLDKKPDDLEDSVWCHTLYYLPGYMGVSGIQHVQKTIFDTTLIAYLERMSYLIFYFIMPSVLTITFSTSNPRAKASCEAGSR